MAADTFWKSLNDDYDAAHKDYVAPDPHAGHPRKSLSYLHAFCTPCFERKLRKMASPNASPHYRNSAARFVKQADIEGYDELLKEYGYTR